MGYDVEHLNGANNTNHIYVCVYNMHLLLDVITNANLPLLNPSFVLNSTLMLHARSGQSLNPSVSHFHGTFSIQSGCYHPILKEDCYRRVFTEEASSRNVGFKLPLPQFSPLPI